MIIFNQFAALFAIQINYPPFTELKKLLIYNSHILMHILGGQKLHNI